MKPDKKSQKGEQGGRLSEKGKKQSRQTHQTVMGKESVNKGKKANDDEEDYHNEEPMDLDLSDDDTDDGDMQQ